MTSAPSSNKRFSKIPVAGLGETAWGLASADFFFDGYPDIIVGTESGKVILFNNSNGAFGGQNLTLFSVEGQAYGLAVTDTNNDNRFDIIVGHKNGHVDIYENNRTDGGIDNATFVFKQTVTTRDQPFGLTTGDFDLDGRIDIMVGDRLGQLEKIIFEPELGRFNGFLFADIGAFAHGLTTADIDYNDKLDLFALGFIGNVNLFYSRAEGMTVDPLVIGNVPNSFGLTSGDYDSDNDVDLIVGSDNGSMTMLLNNLKIRKRSYPDNVRIFGGKPPFGSFAPAPTKRPLVTDSMVENPYARPMIKENAQEF